MSKTLVVGDTHGNYKGLRIALQRASYDLSKDTLIVLGDTMDGWSGMGDIIDYYKHLQEIGCKVIYCLGNHDLAFLIWVAAGCKKGSHLMYGHGGSITEHVYLNRWADQIENHAEWLKNQKQYYIDDQNRLFVHAGWDPKHPFNSEAQWALQEYQWNRSFWRGMYEGKNYAKEFKEVFIGHTPTHKKSGKGAIPMNRRNVWNVDTGGGFYKGKVTVMDINTKEYWQSDTGREHYPIEVSRGS